MTWVWGREVPFSRNVKKSPGRYEEDAVMELTLIYPDLAESSAAGGYWNLM